VNLGLVRDERGEMRFQLPKTDWRGEENPRFAIRAVQFSRNDEL
jgi:hypothetical protein